MSTEPGWKPSSAPSPPRCVWSVCLHRPAGSTSLLQTKRFLNEPAERACVLTRSGPSRAEPSWSYLLLERDSEARTGSLGSSPARFGWTGGGGRVFLLLSLSVPQIGPQRQYVTSRSDSAVSHWSGEIFLEELKSVQLRVFRVAGSKSSTAAGPAPVNRTERDHNSSQTNKHNNKSTWRPRRAKTRQHRLRAGRHFDLVVFRRGGATE